VLTEPPVPAELLPWRRSRRRQAAASRPRSRSRPRSPPARCPFSPRCSTS